MEGTVGDGDVVTAFEAEGLDGGFGDFAGADDEDAGVMEVIEHAEGEVSGDAADGDLAVADGCIGTDPFYGLEAFLEGTVEDFACGFVFLGVEVAGFDLAEDFGFAEDLGVDA